MPVILTTTPLVGAKQSRDSSSALGPRRILAVLMLLLFPALSRALAVPQEKEKTALGSLTSVGEVYVNDSPPAARPRYPQPVKLPLDFRAAEADLAELTGVTSCRITGNNSPFGATLTA